MAEHNLTHGASIRRNGCYVSRLYRSWMSMRMRVLHSSYYEGLTIDPVWDDYEQFARDMGDPPENYELDRIDGTKGYFPDNCRWVDKTTQQRNMRKRVPPIGVAYVHGMKGQITQREMAEVLGCSVRTVRNIVSGRNGFDNASQ